MATDGAPAIFFRIGGLWMRHGDARTVADGPLRAAWLSRDATNADNQEDKVHRPNEKERSWIASLSDGRDAIIAAWLRGLHQNEGEE